MDIRVWKGLWRYFFNWNISVICAEHFGRLNISVIVLQLY